ncbi:MAG TPA: LemA family protein [Kofleriaceae bacterium]|jgi:LemA protein|nr:LemA family protein [Kofleriaceae bacterium]
MKPAPRVALYVVLLGALAVGIGTCTTYNRLVGKSQEVDAQWAQVQNVYQRRADLVPNLVATVKGAAQFERETLREVTEARSRVGQVQLPRGEAPTDPADLQKFQQAQDQLGGALSRLLVVAEQYPNLTATQGFRDLQAQLEGTENRIAVERMRYNEVARGYNTARARFPAALFASFFGDRFAKRPYFVAQAGAEQAPRVEF